MRIPLRLFLKERLDYNDYLPGTVTQFKLPDNWSILKTEVLFKKQLTSSGINAEILELHLQGYLNLKKEDGKIIFSKSEKSPEPLPHEVKLFYKLLFRPSDSLSRNEGTLDLNAFLKSQVLQVALLQVSYTTMVNLIDEGYFVSKKEAIKKYLWLSILPLLISLGINLYISSEINPILLLVGFSLSLSLFQFLEKRSMISSKGYKMMRKIQGLYRYMRIAEEKRIAFANNPKLSVEDLDRLLPYSILFNMKNYWKDYLPVVAWDIFNTRGLRREGDLIKTVLFRK